MTKKQTRRKKMKRKPSSEDSPTGHWRTTPGGRRIANQMLQHYKKSYKEGKLLNDFVAELVNEFPNDHETVMKIYVFYEAFLRKWIEGRQ
jgi:hypothetical protein